MSDITLQKDYDNFSRQSIATVSGNASTNGWVNDYATDEYSTPIDQDNLNAMLDMLIYIRNIIGKTSDFEVPEYLQKKDENGNATVFFNTPTSNGNDNKNIGQYLKQLIEALIGNEVTESTIPTTLKGLKAYLESLDGTLVASDHQWIRSITQTDGKITGITTEQPTLADIKANFEDIDFDNVIPITDPIDSLIDLLQTEVNNRLSLNYESNIPEEESYKTFITSIKQEKGALTSEVRSEITGDDIKIITQQADPSVPLDEESQSLTETLEDIKDLINVQADKQEENEKSFKDVNDSLNYIRNKESSSLPDEAFYLTEDQKSYCLDISKIGDIEDLVVPTLYKLLPVTVVTNTALSPSNTTLKTVILQDNISIIKEKAFWECTALTSIEIPYSVTFIGDGAFNGCTALRRLTLEGENTIIDTNAFDGCTSLEVLNYNIANADLNLDTKPEEERFKYQRSPFTACGTNHEGFIVNIGSKVETLPDYLFKRYDVLNNPTYQSTVDVKIKEVYFSDESQLISIGSYCFYGCEEIKEIVVPDSVTTIGDSAFGACSNLESITLPFVGGSKSASSASSSTLFGYIFGTESYTGGVSTEQYYGSYKTYYIPSSLKTVTITGGNILYGAFYNCSGLTSVTIGNSVTSIDNSAFAYCTSLMSVTIGNRVTSIGYNVFYGCTSLMGVTIGNSVTSIDNSAFSSCTSLESVNISDIAAWCNISFGNEYANPLYYAKNLYLNGNLITNLVIPESVTSISNYAFYSCDSLTSVTIPESVSTIGQKAFVLCQDLNILVINNPNMTLEIGTPLSGEVTGPFDLCPVTQLTCPYSIASNLFLNTPKKLTLTNREEATQELSYILQSYSNLEELILEKININYDSLASFFTEVPQTLKTIKILDSDSVYGFFNKENSLQNIYLNVASIRTPIFENNFNNHIDLTLGHNVSFIGDGVFKDTACLRKVVFEDGSSLTTIEASTFENCTNLRAVKLPETLKEIKTKAFKDCILLKEINTELVEIIAIDAFDGCLNLNSKVNDSQIVLEDPYTFTTSFGYYTLGPNDGYITKGEKGQSLRDFLSQAFCKEDTTIFEIDPSLQFTLNTSLKKEVGTQANITYTVSSNPGLFKWGTLQVDPETQESYPDFNNKQTGIEISNLEFLTFTLVDDNEEEEDEKLVDPYTITYKDNSQQLAVNFKYTIQKATNIPISNLGREISAPDAVRYDFSKDYSFIGYRSMFIGTTKEILITPSAQDIRSKLTAREATTGTFEVTASAGDSQVYFSYPTTFEQSPIFEYEFMGEWRPLDNVTSYTESTEITDENGESYITNTYVSIPGANDYEPISYYIWRYSPNSGSFESNMKIRMRLG